MDWKMLVRMVLPIVIREKAPQLTPFVAVIERGMFQAEDLIAAKGREKLAHAIDLSVTSLEALNLAKGHLVVDPMIARSLGAEVISVTADLTKLWQQRMALPSQTTGTTLSAPPA